MCRLHNKRLISKYHITVIHIFNNAKILYFYLIHFFKEGINIVFSAMSQDKYKTTFSKKLYLQSTVYYTYNGTYKIMIIILQLSSKTTYIFYNKLYL